MLLPVDELLHKYVDPPLAVNVVLVLLQIDIAEGEIAAIGTGLTSTSADAVDEQLLPLITVTE